ncbi:ArsB/NhaD family transporter [Paenibacillus sp. NEAU-GSW1]|uniref:ArsB/NhaD family transporter n=1 Tax=Paenibacillus sp. NEAU-GSW1 TaxID=2682486 RepID=UPI0012E12FB7|nr:ArsB/NhaD family transporter [Paenibacillus sp. NEAU-GSW1]MUT66262.1 arsenical efflux pump membrane protein ArsB [Paenibacillus sp. NEAU-GSW1]
MAMIVSILVFTGALALILWKPKGLHEAFTALAGAAVLFALQLLKPEDAGYIWGFVWNATFSLIGIMVFTSLLDGIGFFRWAALHIVRRYRNRQVLLFALLSLMTACITVFFNNDGAILIMVPIVLETTGLLRLSRGGRLAFLLGVGFMADTASAPLMMSNLTNILTADFFGIAFGEYAASMIVPGIAAIAATILVLTGFFRQRIMREENSGEEAILLPEPAAAIVDKGLFRLAWAVIALMLSGYMLSEALGLPASAIALGGAALQWAASAAKGRAPFRQTVMRAPWLIIVFALAMNLIVYSLHVHGAASWFPALIASAANKDDLIGVIGSGLIFSLLSSVVNNLPAVLISSLAIAQVNGPDYLPYASLIGTSVGAKLTPIGSLATLLWMQLVRQGGVSVSWREYTKYGLLFTFPILLCSLAALYLLR